MAIFPGSAIPSAVSAYDIDNSLRFDDGDSAYLSRTPASEGDRKTWTFSFWTKRGNLSDYLSFIGAAQDSSNRDTLRFSNNDTLNFQWTRGGSSNEFFTDGVFRDPSAWYHIVLAVDTTISTPSANRVKMWVNGVVQTFSTANEPAEDGEFYINDDRLQVIGARSTDGSAVSSYYDGYMAEVYFIDGTQYDADDFGELSSDTNQWIPKDASDLTFGTNGFYQKYGGVALNRDTFTTVESTTWTAPAGVTSVEYLVVAGGGGGGGQAYCPGGGAGGYRTGTLSVTPASSYTVTVGAGGTGATSFVQGGDGGDSVFSSITSDGGGGGGKYTGTSGDSASHGRDGGSGGGGPGSGGAGTIGGSGGAATAGQGYAGGAGYFRSGGGGGGASEVGGDGEVTSSSGTPGGAGGDGLANSISGASVTYAGGGGGGASSNTSDTGTGGAGGAGGGGNGGSGTTGAAQDGTANTGGGGGGVGRVTDAGDGGSGIVIIKYGTSFGNDYSGNDNDFTVTNLVATDQMIDTPTNNWCTMNPLDKKTVVLSEGNLKVNGGGGGQEVRGTISKNTGKWYYEMYLEAQLDSAIIVGVGNIAPTPIASVYAASVGYRSDGYKYLQSSTATTYAATWGVGDIIGVAMNLEDEEVTFYKNNATQGALSFTLGTNVFTPFCRPGASTEATVDELVFNFGQDSSFAGNKTAQGNQDSNEVGDFYYAPPTDYLALCTDNLPDPEIALPGESFNTILYDDGAGAKTGVGFQPDLVWVKSRGSGFNPKWTDSVRGATKAMVPDDTTAETTDSTGLTAFGTDGFTVGADTDYSDTTGTGMVAWSWKASGATTVTNTDGTIESEVSANTTAGFSIVTYTGEGANTDTVGHGLTTTPDMIIVRNLSGDSWIVWTPFFTATTAYVLKLDTSDGVTNNVSWFYNAAPNATTFNPGDGGATNSNTVDYIAYCFESIEGYSKIDKFKGNGDADGPYVYCGFEPAVVIIKQTTGSNWFIYDNKRGTYNVIGPYLIPSTSASEATLTSLDFLSNGFKIRHDGSGAVPINADAVDIIYMAFADSPFKYSNAR
jgi:hypothetical protein